MLFALQPSIPGLTRSGLHRLLERHDISRLPKDDSAKTGKRRFKSYPLGYVHIDICDMRCEEGELLLYVAIIRQQADDPIPKGRGQQTAEANQTAKFVYAKLHTDATGSVAA